MPKQKPKNTITTKEAADKALARMCEICRLLAECLMREAAAVEKARQEFLKERELIGAAGLEKELSLIEKELEVWAKDNRQSWGKKSIELAFGCLGFRDTPPSVVLYKTIAKKEEDALKLLQSTRSAFVRWVPEIHREKILSAIRDGRLSEAALNKYGLKIKEGEVFWIETSASETLQKAVKALKNA